jgi:hypothetical protein
MSGASASLTPEQVLARERWRSRWNLPIIRAAVIPLFVNSPDAEWVQVVIGVGSWIVFLVDLVIQLRIVPGYLHERHGRISRNAPAPKMRDHPRPTWGCGGRRSPVRDRGRSAPRTTAAAGVTQTSASGCRRRCAPSLCT